MAGLKCGEGNEEYSNMSNGTVVSDRSESGNRRILHREGQQPGEGTLRACPALKALFKGLRAIIDSGSDIGIASKIGSTVFAFKEFWMEPGTDLILPRSLNLPQ
jgi:hypothetical protein